MGRQGRGDSCSDQGENGVPLLLTADTYNTHGGRREETLSVHLWDCAALAHLSRAGPLKLQLSGGAGGALLPALSVFARARARSHMLLVAVTVGPALLL